MSRTGEAYISYLNEQESRRYFRNKERFIRTWRKYQNPEYRYDTRYIGQEFDRLMLGIRDHRVGDMAVSIWMLCGFDIQTE